MPNPKYHEALKNGYSVYKIPEFINNFSILPDGSMYIPRGYRAKLYGLVKKFNVKHEIKDERTYLEPISIDCSMINLRDYQSKAMINMTSKGDEGLLVSPAGSGKTVIGLSLLPMLGQKMLWLTHTKPLLNQVLDRLAQLFPDLKEEDVGIIGSGKWKIGNIFTAAMIQTLARRPEDTYTLRDLFGIVILDEAHHVPATTFTQVLGSLNPFFLYGLTATHIRRDGLHHLMFQILGPVLEEVPLQEVKDYGSIIIPTILCRYTNCSPKQEEFGKILIELAEDRGRNKIIVGDIIAEAKQGNICIAMTDRKVHAEKLYEMLSAEWDKTEIATGDYTKKQLETSLKKLVDGECTVLVATSALLSEGFDHAPINRGFLCLPFRNMVKTEQIIGRLQRTAKGKKDAVIYDYVDKHSLLQHQFYNKGPHGCRWNVYRKLGCSVRKT